MRRVVSLLERTVRQELAWTVFEVNDRVLRSRLELLLNQLLARLFALGAFAGATPAQSWFVRTADAPGMAAEADAGQLVCWIGVAPAEPVEFIIVCVSLDGRGRGPNGDLPWLIPVCAHHLPVPGRRWRAAPARGGSGALGTGGFQECSGLEVEMDTSECPEGGAQQRGGAAGRAGQVHQAGAQARDVVPARRHGRLVAVAVAADVVDGVRPIARYDGTIEVLDDDEAVVATWTFSRGLPAKLVGTGS